MKFGRPHAPGDRPTWKHDALTTFTEWLDALPDEAAPADDAPPSPDTTVGLVDLADAMTVLARETKALARTSDQSRRRLESFLEDAGAQGVSRAEVEAREARWRTEADERGRQQSNDILRDVGDAYESLCTARDQLAQLDQAPTPSGWFRRPVQPAARLSAAPAVDIPLRKLKDILHRNDVVVVARIGEPFDAKIMRAGAVSERGQVPPGAVSEIVRQGYRMKGELILSAEVIVEKEIET